MATSAPIPGDSSYAEATLNKAFIFLLFICALTFLPWLGMTPFNTKGEPREAVVAMSMLQQHNWILPVSCGGDIPYKPPFLAWLIALFSFPLGHVTEYTSRLPSALAVIAMVTTGFRLYCRRTSTSVAMIAAIVTFTAFEVNRAGMSCRVDMVLTAFSVMAMYSLFRHFERPRSPLPWGAVALMSCAVLTKGPVGALLPCLVTGIYLLIRGHRFWPVLGRLAAVGALSLVVPAIWYAAAYNVGGDEFLRLAIEENFGRFTGSMSYESHSKPIYYNLITLIAGWLPYTILALLSLFVLKAKRPDSPVGAILARMWMRIRLMRPIVLYSLVAIVTIFLFYCIPDSKRSVYLLPMYPFMGYFIALLVIRMAYRHRAIFRIFGSTLALLSIIVAMTFVALRFIDPSPQWFSGHHATQDFDMAYALHATPVYLLWVLWILAVWTAIVWFKVSRDRRPLHAVAATLTVIVTLYWSLAGLYQPIVLSTKSDRDIARVIDTILPVETLYTYISTPMLRYYTVNFYLGDRTIPVTDALASGASLTPTPLPAEGHILLNDQDLPRLQSHFPSHTFIPVYTSSHPSCDTRRPATLYHFTENP